MRFEEFKYERPIYEDIKKEYSYIIENINKNDSYNNQVDYINEANVIRNDIKTMNTLVSIRYSLNTEDKYYQIEKSYWDEYLPLYDELNDLFYKSILNSKFKNKLKNKFTEQFFNIIEYSCKSFSSDIISELQRENELCSKYTKLLASARFKFNEEELNLSSMGKYMIDSNQSIRKESSKIYYDFFKNKEKDFELIFDELVTIRHSIATKLGYDNFIEVGYMRMMRTDYDSSMVEVFREQIKNSIVPIANKLYENQKSRLDLDRLTYIDENLEFLDGNATPKGSYTELIENAQYMYKDLSIETDEFFKFMVSNNLMDVESRQGKGMGGYCTYIPNYKSPFIFANFNSTSDDIDVLTHEAGHAFQLYMSRWIDIPEINFPTLDSCEIHSMGMEFLTWPYMDLFFKEDTHKYKFVHMSSAIKFMPYGALVDEFQHKIYENPRLSNSERRKVWRDLEKVYMPHKDYDDNEFLESGTWWFKQGHIFKNPFYYIDYVLAQICALQLWSKSQTKKEESFNDYINICKIGGSESFTKIVKVGNMISPFEKGCIDSVTNTIKKWLF